VIFILFERNAFLRLFRHDLLISSLVSCCCVPLLCSLPPFLFSLFPPAKKVGLMQKLQHAEIAISSASTKLSTILTPQCTNLPSDKILIILFFFTTPSSHLSTPFPSPNAEFRVIASYPYKIFYGALDFVLAFPTELNQQMPCVFTN